MEGRIAKWYAANTGKSMEEFRATARQVTGEIAPHSRVLEVAPGPGYFAIELAKLGDYRVEGLDISKTFVEIASRNARDNRVEASFLQGNASHMPFENDIFDFIFCRAAFKNFSEPVQALQEMHRVLKPGGKGLLADLRSDASPGAIRQFVRGMGLGFASRILTRLTFRFMLLNRAYSRDQFRDFFSRTNFRSVEFQENPIGFAIRFEK
ncbi:MAG TPA: class I SAM-dependent methyltransferase [Bryobacteraceae bacterium]|nr:class I SAM-dependent methyltransferase [Bryobacteraceae bacterium]